MVTKKKTTNKDVKKKKKTQEVIEVKEEKEYKPSKWLYAIFVLLPLIYIVSFTDSLDNDLWYLLSEGRYILQHGIYYIEPLTIHEGLTVTVQNWASASLFYIVYHALGEYGIIGLILLCSLGISYFSYKICMVISDKNRVLSLLGMLATNLIITMYYMVSRPQIFSFVLLLAVIYVLELYANTENSKYLRWLPVLSIIEANMHGSLWFMIFLFALCYIIDGIKLPFLRTQGYKLKPLLLWLGIAALCGLINPYGYKMITFIFTSFGNKYMHIFINELLPLSIKTNIGQFVFGMVMVVGLCLAFFREGKVRIRYICLFCGTLILGVSTVKACSHFMLVAAFPLAYFFKDMFPKTFEDLGESIIKILRYAFIVITVVLIGMFSYSTYLLKDNIKLESEVEACADVIKKTYGTDARVFSTFNTGGQVEFYGLKPYIDPRAEVYLKINNGKDEIFNEFYDLSHNNLDFSVMQEKYHFTHAIVTSDLEYYQDILDSGFVVIYEDVDEETHIDSKYRVLASKSILTEEELEKYTNIE